MSALSRLTILLLGSMLFTAGHVNAEPTLERCFVQLGCSGHVNPVSPPGNYLGYTPVNAVLGVKYYFAIPSGTKYPSITELYDRDPARIRAFESACNKARYQILGPLLNPNIGVAWYEDSNHLNARHEFKCVTGNCGGVAQPCATDVECCSGTSQQLKCDKTAGACVVSNIKTEK